MPDNKITDNLFVLIAEFMNTTHPDPERANYRVRTENILDVQLVIEAIFLFLYVYILYVLLTSKKKVFRSSFYLLFIIGGFNDIPIAIAIEFTRQIRMIGLCVEYELPIRIAFIMTETNYIVHFLINILITLNRLTSVALPVAHKNIWRIWRVWHIVLAVIIMAIISIGTYSDILTRPRTFYVKDDFCFQRNNYTMKTVYASATAVVIFEIDCVIISPITIYKIYKVKQMIHMNTGAPRKKQELSLAFFAVIKAVLYICELVYEVESLIPLSIAKLWFFQVVSEQFFAYFFGLMIGNGVILLVLSNDLRAEIRNRWGFKKTAVIPLTIPNPSEVPSSAY